MKKQKLSLKISPQSETVPSLSSGDLITVEQRFRPMALPSMFWKPEYIEPSFNHWIGHMPFAFWVVEAMKPSCIVELGTHYGNSYFSFCQAVERLGLVTSCFAVDTWAGDIHMGAYGNEVFSQVDGHNAARYPGFSTLVRSTFDEATSHFEDESIDLLHIDGTHTFEAVRHDFETWLPKLSPRGVVLFHDTNVRVNSFGVSKLFATLKSKYPWFEFKHSHGLGIIATGSNYPLVVKSLFETSSTQDACGEFQQIFARLGQACLDLGETKTLNKRLNDSVNLLNSKEINLKNQLAELGKLAERISVLERDNEEVRQAADSERGYLSERIRGMEEEKNALEEQRSRLERDNEEVRQAADSERGYLSERIRGLEEEKNALEDSRGKVAKLGYQLDAKSSLIDRYIHESARAALLIVDAKKNASQWRRNSTPTEVEEIILGCKQEDGDLKHIDFKLKWIEHIGRRFSDIDIRIINHHGDSGIIVFEPDAGERPFYGWIKSGTENGRDFMLLIPKHKTGRAALFAATTNDLLLLQGIVLGLVVHLESKTMDANAIWIDSCKAILNEIQALPLRLHYDDVTVLENDGHRVKVKMLNPSWRNCLISMDIITLRSKKIHSIQDEKSNYLPDWGQASNFQRELIGAYRKEIKNILFHVNK